MTVTADTRHLTASAAVFDPRAGLYLVVHHLLTGQWQFPGGHLDPDETGDECARREVREETGVDCSIWMSTPTPARITVPNGRTKPGPFMVCEFPAPADPAKGNPAHSHIDLLYLATADSSLPMVGQEDEVAGVAWLPVGDRGAAVRPDVPFVVEAAWQYLCDRSGLPLGTA